MKRLLIGLLFVGVLSGCDEAIKVAVSRDGRDRVVTHCVGRLTLDLPQSWRHRASSLGAFEPEGVDEDGDDIEILTNENWTNVLFKRSIAERLAEIKAYADTDTDVLELHDTLSAEETLFRIKRVGSSYSSELHKLVNGTYVRLRSDSYNGKFAAAEQRLKNFSRGIQVDDSSPSRKGFCIGKVTVAGDFVKESAQINFETPSHKDALISVGVDTYRADESESLFERVGGKDSLLTKFGINASVIRKREIQAAGMKAQEWMSWMPLDGAKDSKYLLFALETRRAQPGRQRPQLHMEFETGRRLSDGERLPNSFSEDDAVMLWDHLVRSISAR